MRCASAARSPATAAGSDAPGMLWPLYPRLDAAAAGEGGFIGAASSASAARAIMVCPPLSASLSDTRRFVTYREARWRAARAARGAEVVAPTRLTAPRLSGALDRQVAVEADEIASRAVMRAGHEPAICR